MILDSTVNMLKKSIKNLDCNDYIRMALADILKCGFRELFLNSGFQRETSCFYTPEHNFLSLTSDDSPGSVDFNWEKIWGKIQDSNIKPSCAYMVHSHPPCCYEMSPTDKNMVQGWRMALGCPIFFSVLSANKNKYDPIQTTAYLVDRVNNKMEIKKEHISFNNCLNINHIIITNLVMAISYVKNLSPQDLEVILRDLNELKFY